MLRALRVSRLTICPLGQPEKAIGLEPQIEPWLTPYDHTACPRSEAEGRRHPSKMNHGKGKITGPHSMKWAGCQDQLSASSSRRRSVSLDIPFYRTRKPDKCSRLPHPCRFCKVQVLTFADLAARPVCAQSVNIRTRIKDIDNFD